MEINEDILARYHLRTCTAAERKAVEEWLFSAETGGVDWELLKQEKDAVGKDMWEGIETILPKPACIKPKSNTYFMWKGAIAASAVFALLATAFCIYFLKDTNHHELMSLNNSSHVNVKHISSNVFNVSLGPNTMAQINQLEGVIDLTGSILISPKENVDLIFKGTQKKVTLKKGQTYIILKGKGTADEIIVISERNLLDLPPVIQKQITTQFDI